MQMPNNITLISSTCFFLKQVEASCGTDWGWDQQMVSISFIRTITDETRNNRKGFWQHGSLLRDQRDIYHRLPNTFDFFQIFSHTVYRLWSIITIYISQSTEEHMSFKNATTESSEKNFIAIYSNQTLVIIICFCMFPLVFWSFTFGNKLQFSLYLHPSLYHPLWITFNMGLQRALIKHWILILRWLNLKYEREKKNKKQQHHS